MQHCTRKPRGEQDGSFLARQPEHLWAGSSVATRHSRKPSVSFISFGHDGGGLLRLSFMAKHHITAQYTCHFLNSSAF